MTNKFDIDLQYGQVRERRLADMLSNDKIEVKTERDIWKATGNIAIEYKYKGNPTYCTLLFPTNKLKEIARKYHSKAVYGGDDNLSKFVLLPLKEVFNGQT